MHIQKATFLAVQHWLLGTIATHFSVPPFVSLTFCVSHVICSQPSNAASTTQAWDQSDTAWLPPPCGNYNSAKLPLKFKASTREAENAISFKQPP